MSDGVMRVLGVDVLHLSPVSGVLGVYVAVLAALVFRYAYRNLAGEVDRGRFLGWLGFTVVAVEGLVASGNFVVFLGFWFATSAGVHHLLGHYRHRWGARLVAWEKFLVSRIGDLALVAAAALLGATRGSLNFADLEPQPWSDGTAGVAAWLLVLGALTKSAQVPFHSWLPRTLEAPTAVSALLHAGILNAGGILLIRFGFLVQSRPEALAVLVGVGGLTAAWGGFTMLVQADVKRRLAWSTVGQMGFMMLEIGLGAPALALVHLMGHGLYKARVFLWSGDPKTGQGAAPADQGRLAATVRGLILWVATAAVAGLAVGTTAPGHLVVTLVVAGALTPLAVGGWARRGQGLRAWAAAVAVGTASGAIAWVAPGVLGLPDALSSGNPRDLVGLGVAGTLFAWGVVTAFSPWLAATDFYRRIYASALHGFGGGRWPGVLASSFVSRSPSQPSGGAS